MIGHGNGRIRVLLETNSLPYCIKKMIIFKKILKNTGVGMIKVINTINNRMGNKIWMLFLKEIETPKIGEKYCWFNCRGKQISKIKI